MKKLSALIVALAFMLGIGFSSFAAGHKTHKTLNGPKVAQMSTMAKEKAPAKKKAVTKKKAVAKKKAPAKKKAAAKKKAVAKKKAAK